MPDGPVDQLHTLKPYAVLTRLRISLSLSLHLSHALANGRALVLPRHLLAQSPRLVQAAIDVAPLKALARQPPQRRVELDERREELLPAHLRRARVGVNMKYLFPAL